MTLVVKDLGGRLQSGVFFRTCIGDRFGLHSLQRLPDGRYVVNEGGFTVDEIKPYLRPMSDMTEEEINEFILISDTVLRLGDKRSTCILSLEQMDWLNGHHFDYRDLIGRKLALKAPKRMYTKKRKV